MPLPPVRSRYWNRVPTLNTPQNWPSFITGIWEYPFLFMTSMSRSTFWLRVAFITCSPLVA